MGDDAKAIRVESNEWIVKPWETERLYVVFTNKAVSEMQFDRKR